MKGPIPAFLAFALLLLGAYGWRGAAGVADRGPDVGYPFARCIAKAVEGDAISGFGPAYRLVAILVFAAAAAILFRLILYWTGNRVVSFAAGGLFALHPAVREPLLGGDALVHTIPVALGLLALAFREAGWNAWRFGRSPLRCELLAALVYALACVAGPAALGIPLLVALVEAVFHYDEPAGRRKETVAIPVAYIVIAFTLWHFDEPAKWRFSAGPSVFVERGARLLLLPLSGAAAAAVTALLLVAGAGLLGLGLRSLRRTPRWIAIYAGFAVAWWFLAELPAVAGIVPAVGARQMLGVAGPALVLPALVWRALLRVVPPATAGPLPPPLFDVPPPAPAAAPCREPAPLPESAPAPDHGPSSAVLSSAQIRASVEVAVTAAVASAVLAARRGLATPSGRQAAVAYAAEWDANEKAWAESSTGTSKKLLGSEWSHRALEQNVFDNFFRPWLGETTRVLELGGGGGVFTAMIAPLVARIVCLDVARAPLRRAREEFRDQGNVEFVLSGEHGLDALAAGSFDFAFSYDGFVHLDQEDVYLYLRELWRVLRPGGRAVLAFANLADPLGFAQFEESARRYKVEGRGAARVNFLAPEMIRMLATAARFGIESFHLAANNRDMIVILER